MQQPRKILVLYEELAWYVVNCMNTFAEAYRADVLWICRRPSAVAPFDFPFIHPGIKIMQREDQSEKQLLQTAKDFSADAVFLCGWAYKPYISIVKELRKPTTIGFDNQWVSSLKQMAGALYFRLFLKRYISGAFVPGARQFHFAEKLGFEKKNILEGSYCADTGYFHSLYEKYKTEKAVSFPKRFLYVGRYAPEKKIEALWDAFVELQNESPNSWELWCLGKGSIKPVVHPKIKHFGFLQPHEMDSVIEKTGVFILPSIFEPWGVVVHECAAAGLPLLCSDKVGAADFFLLENENGFSFTAGNKEQLKSLLKKYMQLSERELNGMSFKSAAAGNSLTPSIWAEKLMRSFMK